MGRFKTTKLNAVKLQQGIKAAKSSMKALEESVPEAKTVAVGAKTLDTQQAFFLFCSFSGDFEKTAHALNITPEEVAQLAQAEEWEDKIRPILKLRKSKRSGDVERALNRSMNFVQAHQMRLTIQRLMSEFSQMTNDELLSYCLQEVTTTKKDGSVTVEKKLTTRPFADLASALEKCHMLSYYSLADTTTERGRKGDAEEGPTQVEMHSAIAEALSKVGKTPQARLMDSQLAHAKEVAETDVVSVKVERSKRDSSPSANSAPSAGANFAQKDEAPESEAVN